MQFLEANYSEPGLSPDAVAEHFGMSRRSLFHLFEGHRVHLGEHLRALRTIRALELLTDPSASGMSATDIACSAGFSNLQSLRRALKHAVGLTVREARHEPLLARSYLVRLRESARLTL
jgi:transcriptional regulator GlxA family with amidase domain